MPRGMAILAALALAAGAGPEGPRPQPEREAPAESVALAPDQQTDVSVTIYNGNLGLVKDVREVTLPRGVSALQFMDVAAQIDPTTVRVKSLTDPARLNVLEQNYEYDLLGPDKLMNKYVGRKVKLLTSDGTAVMATLLSNNNGSIYEINGEIRMGHLGQVVLPEIPKDLIPKPTLVWRLENGSQGPQELEASYLTSGITWKADYVVVLNSAESGGDLSGWVTLDNKSGATYRNASLKLVAGDVHRATREGERHREMKALAGDVADEAGFREEGFFEYHLYTLQRRTTVKDSQTKQISLLSANDIPIRKELRFYGAHHYYLGEYGVPISNQKVGVFLEIANTEANNLGMPLPKGTVRVYEADSQGSLQFVGEDTIDHTPADERVKIKMGEAFDVVGGRVQRDFRRVGERTHEVEWEIRLRNHKTQDVEVTVIEPVPGDWTVVKSTHPYEKPEAHTLTYRIAVPKKEEVRIGYRVRIDP